MGCRRSDWLSTPHSTMRAEIVQGRMVAVKLHAPELVRPVGAVHRSRKRLNRAAQAFVELLWSSRGRKRKRNWNRRGCGALLMLREDHHVQRIPAPFSFVSVKPQSA
jgi:hypothetical protein